MSYTESGVKMIAEIKKILIDRAVASSTCWYGENADGITVYAAFGRVDVRSGDPGARFTIDIVSVESDVPAGALGSVLIITDIDDDDRAAAAAGDDDIMLGKIEAAAGAAARRVVGIMDREYAAGCA